VTREHLQELLSRFERGELTADELREQLVRLPFRELGDGDVRLDTLRGLRQGAPEVVLGCGKSAAQIAAIARALGPGDGNLLVTRVPAELAEQVRRLEPELSWHERARCLVLHREPIVPRGRGPVAVVTAGTSDVPVAEEAALTAELHGSKVERIYDVGVAGLHRLLASLDTLRAANVVIVVAGMEGALPSVVGGLVDKPVIAVPTSVGYGAAFGGLAALLGMLTSCASNVAVVNIDNGFGAAYVATLVNRL
jgi:NCAIR mutase (PurE)-related protein